MNSSAAIPILQALADGLDPATGQLFPPDSPYQQADTIRALHAALDALKTPVGKPRRPVDPGKPAAGQKWTPEEDQRLRDAFAAQTPYSAIAVAHGRTRSAIESRLVKLGLITITTPAPSSFPGRQAPTPPQAPVDNYPF